MGISKSMSSDPALRGGVLMFFPTYSVLIRYNMLASFCLLDFILKVMDSTATRWKECGIFAQLKELLGDIVIEGRAGSFNSSQSTAGGFNRAASKVDVTDEIGGEDANFAPIIEGTIAQFEKALETHGKCLLLAVCRGKVSGS